MAPCTKKRGSKKSKQSWRKNVDLKDVENFLEDQRLEERLGIKYAEQKNDDLFHIDTEGAQDEKTCDKMPLYKQSIKTIGNSLRLTETETPKCFEILVKRSAVPAQLIKKACVKKRNNESYVTKAIFKRKLQKELPKAKTKVEEKHATKKPEYKMFTYDVWSEENSERKLNDCSEWLSNDTIRHTLHNTGYCRKRIPKTIQNKTSLLPAIEIPHPGSSYNPSLKDHKNILEKVVESEVKLTEEEKHLDRVTIKMFNKIPKHKLEEEWLSEMTVGLSMNKTESDEDDREEYKAVNPPVKNKKKTLKKRRKLREAMELKQKLQQQKIEKKKLSDIYKLKKFRESLDKKEEKILQNIEKRKQNKEKKPYITKLLSQTKYKEPEIDFSMAEELTGNLRGIKQEGSILYDRFKSLQKRNILQPTLKRHVKKRKVKKYERAHTKMGWEPKGYVPYVKNQS